MLDAGLRVTFRHFWTLFFVAAIVTVPLHLIYVFAFHGPIGLRELAPQIEQLPRAREVHYVAASDFERARLALWVVDAVELALLPLAIRAARGVVAADERGEVPTATRAWTSALRWQHGRRTRYGTWLLAALLIAALVGALCDAIGRLFAEPFGVDWSFVVLGLSQGAARAAGAAFFLGPAALTETLPRGDLSRGGLP
jgi:hypothetical protein